MTQIASPVSVEELGYGFKHKGEVEPSTRLVSLLKDCRTPSNFDVSRQVHQ